MNTFNRRTFIKLAGAAAAGVGTLNRGVAVADDAGEEFPSVTPEAAQVDPAKLAKAIEFVEAEVKAGSVQGASLVATRRGKKFVEHYCGTYRTLDGADKPYHRDVSSPLFSFSKGISATVAVMAHQDGLIDYDVPVSTYIPEFKEGGKEAVTIRHLLTHSAGIPSVGGDSVLTEERWTAFVKKVCAAPIEWPAGSRSQYHGCSGSFVVAEAIRRVSDMRPWNAICRERLFDPVGAKSLSFNELPPEYPVALAPGYFKDLDTFALGGHPAGGCFGTVDDMLRVLNLVVYGGTWHGKVLIKPEPLREMLTVQYAGEIAKALEEGKKPTHEPWGLGWLIRGIAPESNYWFGFGDSKSPTLFGHAGVDTVYGDGDPARDLAFVFLMTTKPKDAAESTRIRGEVSNRLQAAVLEA